MTTTTRADRAASVPGGAGGPVRSRAAAREPRRRARVLPALAAETVLLVRGLRRDALLLLAWCAVVALAVGIAVGAPRVTAGVLDAGARGDVRDAGRAADLVVDLRATSPEVAEDYRARARDAVELPTLRGVLGDTVLTFAVARLDVQGLAEAPGGGRARVPDTAALDATWLPSADAVRVVEGDLAADPADERALPVAVPEATARAWRLEVGDVLVVAGPRTGDRDSLGNDVLPARVEVVAVVAPRDEDDLLWADARHVWQTPGRAPAPVLVTTAVARELSLKVGAPVHGVVRMVVDPDRFDAGTVAAVADELRALEVSTRDVVPRGVAGTVLVETGLPRVLAEHQRNARAATAQMAVPTAGVVGVVAVALLLVARLVVGRRRAVLELERARGASVGATVARLSAESVLVTGVAAAVALGALRGLLPGPTSVAPLAAVVATAVVAAPVWGGAVVRRAWSGSRVPANRRDRDRLARRRAAARLVAEAAVVALAAGAAVALRSRGLLQTTTGGVDPFLAAAPLVIAAAVTVVALRVYPWAVRLLAALARRSPGVLGVVGAARARRAIAPLPLLALTLAAAVGSTGLLLVSTVRDGQEVASWARVGADVAVTLERRTGLDARDVAEAVAGDPRVAVASAAYLREEQRVDLGNRDATVSVMAVDPAFSDLLAQVPGSGTDLAAFADLAAVPARVPEGTLPAVVDERLAGRIGERGITLTVERRRVTLEIVGTTDHAPRGLAPGPFLYLPLQALFDDDGEPVRASVAWVQGVADDARAGGTGTAGAEAAVAEAAAALELPDGAVATRADWLAERRGDALVGGVERALLWGALAAVALAVVAMVATVLAGSRERGRALALLRTLGMRSGLGWWLVLVELAPVVVAAALAGAAAGATVVGLLGRALGLDVLAGGPGLPPVVVDPLVPTWLAGGAVVLLLVAAAAEVAAHRRDRLSEVVRVGETPS